MKLLVTGGLGFIGSNFIVKLLENTKDVNVVNIDAEYLIFAAIIKLIN